MRLLVYMWVWLIIFEPCVIVVSPTTSAWRDSMIFQQHSEEDQEEERDSFEGVRYQPSMSQSFQHPPHSHSVTSPSVSFEQHQQQRPARMDRECIMSPTVMKMMPRSSVAVDKDDDESECRLSSSLHRLQLEPQPLVSYDVGGHRPRHSPRLSGRPSLSSSSSSPSPLPSSSVCRSSSSPFSRAAARARAADRTPPSSSSSFANSVFQSHHTHQQQQRIVDGPSSLSASSSSGSGGDGNSIFASQVAAAGIEPVAFRARPCALPGVEITRPVPLRSRVPPPSVTSVSLSHSPRSTSASATSPSIRSTGSHRGGLLRPGSPRCRMRSASPRSCGGGTTGSSGSAGGSARAARSWSTGEMRPSSFANAGASSHSGPHGGCNGGSLLHGAGNCHPQVMPPAPHRVMSFGSAVTPPSSTTDGDDARASWEWSAEQDALRRRRVATFLTSASNSSSSSIGSAPPSLLVDRMEFSTPTSPCNNNSSGGNHSNLNNNSSNNNSAISSLFSSHQHNHPLHHHHPHPYGYCHHHHHHSNVMPHRSFSRVRFQGPHVRQARSLSALAGEAQNQRQHRVPSPVSPRVVRKADGPRLWDGHESSSPLPAVRHASAFRFRKLPSHRVTPPDAFHARNVYQNYHHHHLNLHHHNFRDRGEECFLGDPPLNSPGRTRRRFRLFKRKLSVSALRWGSNNC